MLARLVPRLGPTELIRLGASLVLALLLWGWVTTLKDPETTRTFPGLEIQKDPLPGTLEVVSQLPPVAVRLSGPRSVVNPISASDIDLHLDLRKVDQTGSYTVHVLVKTPSGVRSRHVDPEEVPITVDQRISRQFTLTPIKPVATDSARRVGDITPEVSAVTVDGPSTLVSRVARVVLPVDLDDQTADFTGTFSPVAQDITGTAISDVTVRPQFVSALVRVAAQGKSVPVIKQVNGQPADGYEVVDRTASPANVLIDGPKDILDNVISVKAAPVDISGAKTTQTTRVALVDLPRGVRVVDPADGMVDIVVQIKQQGETQLLPSSPITVTGLGPGLQATVSPQEINVDVLASNDVLGSLKAGDIQVRVDVTGLGPGSHDVAPSVALPPNVQWTRTVPAEVTVTILPWGAASPAASPAGSPAARGAIPRTDVAGTPRPVS